MPFTFSHPAAVIPIRRYGVLSALVVGSIMPDLLYFAPGLRVRHSGYGHTLPGLFVFCLPVGLVVLWVFHYLFKKPLISLFPAPHQRKLLPIAAQFSFFPSTRFLEIAGSILLGAASHITWDSWTHSNGWMVKHFELMRDRVTVLPHYSLPVYEAMQYASSVIGLALILFYYFRWLRNTPEADSASGLHLSTPIRVTLLIILSAGALEPAITRFIANPSFWSQHSRYDFVGYSVIAGLTVLYIEIILFSIVWHVTHLFRQTTQTGPVSE